MERQIGRKRVVKGLVAADKQILAGQSQGANGFDRERVIQADMEALFTLGVSHAPDCLLLDAWEERSIAMHAQQQIIIIDELAPYGWRTGEPGETVENPAPKKYHEVVERQDRLRAAKLRKEEEDRARAKRGIEAQGTARPPVRRFEDTEQSRQVREDAAKDTDKPTGGPTITRGD